MTFSTKDLLFAFGLTLLAGLSTGIGSVLAFYTRQTNKKFLSATLGFSAGVMLYVSMIEIFAKARASLEAVFGASKGFLITTIAFFGGIFLIALIDKWVPDVENPHEMRDVKEMETSEADDPSLLRMGLFSALAIAIHTSEGCHVCQALQDPTLGISITVAIALHNIPEGIAVSVPVYYATETGGKPSLFFLVGAFGTIRRDPRLFPVYNFSPAMFGVILPELPGLWSTFLWMSCCRPRRSTGSIISPSTA